MRFNELYQRNTTPTFWEEDNTMLHCNCGSYALNLTTWFVPYLSDREIERMEDEDAYLYDEYEREYYMTELIKNGHDRFDVMSIITEIDWEFILKACPWLVPITKEEINDTDRIIAYRLMLEDVDPEDFDVDLHTDFHFRVRINGEWWEKNGGGPIHSCGTETDDFPWENDPWVYDGVIKYAKFKEGV